MNIGATGYCKMQIILIAGIAGVVVAILTNVVVIFYKETQLEKRLKGKINKLSEIQKVGVVGNIVTIASKIGGFLEGLNVHVFAQMVEKTRVKLLILGQPYSEIKPYTFLAIQFLACIVTIIFSIVFLSIYSFGFLMLLGVLGFFIPQLYISEQVKSKHKAIFRQLPDLLDLLTLMVEAGLDFGAALNKIFESEEGPLIDEFRKTQQEIKLGRSRVMAFNDMAERISYLPLTTVINSLNITFNTGGSIAPTLRVLS